MKIYIGADHAGFELKENLKKFLEKAGHVVVDCGAFSYNPDDDYPDFIIPVAKAVSESKKVSESLAVVMVSRARDSSGKFRCVVLGMGEKLHRGALGNTFLLRFVNADEDICIFQPTA